MLLKFLKRKNLTNNKISNNNLKKNRTKAQTLYFINKNLKKYKINNIRIPEFLFFSKSDFLNNRRKIIFKIKRQFKKKKIILRSSSLSEDNINLSNAGKYLSIPNLKTDTKIIETSINKIIKKFDSFKDQVLVQEFIDKTEMSGVIFTREANYNSPYYLINYDTSGKTNIITSGKNNTSIQTVCIFRDKINADKKFKNFLKSIKGLEKIMGSDRIDIEFAKKNNKWILFQCRPLPGHYLKKNIDIQISKSLVNIKKKIDKLKKKNPTIKGDTTYFSNMADWNPAEMIGVKPKILAMSLYSELITDSIWSIQRKNYNYKDVSPNILMVNLAGSPFIDLRTDFNSFLPYGLGSSLEKKIINNYLRKLKSKTYLHDKIEFELLPTCYDLNMFSSSLNFLNKKTKKEYLSKLRETTNYIINPKNNLLNNEITKVSRLEKKINEINKFRISEIQKIFFLINDCKKLGTLPFSGIARIAFICTKILRSLLDRNLIDSKFVEKVYSSIPTITKKMSVDYLKTLNSNKFKKKFLEDYGHLRPFTYSIASKNYKEGFDRYFSSAHKKIPLKLSSNLKINNSLNIKISKMFKKEGLKINFREFVKLLQKSIEYREYSKFIFSKSINSVFENLIKFTKKLNIKREDLEYVSIKKILDSYSVLETEKLALTLNRDIKNNKKSYEILRQIKFPDFITSSSDVYFHKIKASSGNFITNKKISGNLIYLNDIKNLNKLNKKIVIIENADPGFDFIFSYQIKGLITKYGGANSHMAIRCIELNIPAIIGIGQSGFDSISESNFIEFDCEQKSFKIIN